VIAAPKTTLCHLTVMDQLGRGGAEQALVVLLPELQKLGIRCEVAAASPPYDLEPDLEARGIPVHRWDISFKNVFHGTRLLLRTVRERRVDIIHTHSIYPAFYSGLSAPLARTPRRIMSFHNLGYSSYPADTVKRKLLKVATRFTMQHGVDTFVAPSQAVADHYQQQLGLHGIKVVPHLLDPDALAAGPVDRSATLTRLGVDPGAFTIAMVGRFVHEKGHRLLLESLDLLRRDGLIPNVLMVGDGPLYRKIQERVAAMNLQKQVKLFPAAAHRDAMAIIQASDLVVIPSTHEGFSLVAVEAILLGKPVVASSAGGLAEVVRDGISGISVAPGNSKALAAAIAGVINDYPHARQLAAKARPFILDLCSTEAVMARWRNILSLPDRTGGA
jgi:glycosyltransferase involved in cell wall biosynthesis